MWIESAKVLKFEREFKVDVSSLFQAWADPKLYATWWQGLLVKELDFRIGGKYRLGWRNVPESEAYGEYLEIVPDQKIVFSWSSTGKCGSDGRRDGVQDTRVILEFKSTGPKSCQLTLRHEGLPSDSEREGHHLGWMWALWEADSYFNASQRDLADVPPVIIERRINASPERVYEAWTAPELIMKWWNQNAPRGPAKAVFPNQVGSYLQLDHETEDGELYPHYCELLEIVPNRKLRFKWLSDVCQYESEVIVELKPVGNDQTDMKLTHLFLADPELRADHTEGWEACLGRMKEMFTR